MTSTHEGDERKSRHILFPIDGSENSRRAVRWYLENFQRPDDHVYLVLIAEPEYSRHTYDISPTRVADELEKKIEAAVKDGKTIGQEFQDMFKDRVRDTKFAIQIGNKPGEQVIRIAREKEMDMIIVGNRGVGTLRRTFLGSVSDHILHHSSIPVLLVPPGT